MQSQGGGKKQGRGDLKTLASLPIINTDMCHIDMNPPAAGLSVPLCPPTPSVGNIRSAPAVIMASNVLMGAGPGAPAPFHPPVPSPHGYNDLCAGVQVPHVFPHAPASGQVDDCIISKFSFSNNPKTFLTGNSPLGITCNNTAHTSNPLLITDGFESDQRVVFTTN